jgi:hypothetical protein
MIALRLNTVDLLSIGSALRDRLTHGKGLLPTTRRPARVLRFMTLVIIAGLLPCRSGAAQCVAQATIDGERGCEGFGPVAGLGDITGDGVPDFAVGAKHHDVLDPSPGKLYVYDGAALSILYTMDGEEPLDLFGGNVVALGDVDGDGWNDLAVSAKAHGAVVGYGPGRVYILSGPTGALIRIHDGDPTSLYYGEAMASLGDITGDGRADYVLGEALFDESRIGVDCGRAVVFSGADGSVVHTFLGAAAQMKLGRKVAGLGDVDGDGVHDLAIGAPLWPAPQVDIGKAFVYSGATFDLLHEFTGAVSGQRIGEVLAGVDDVSGDGVPDIIVNASHDYAAIYSGEDFSLVRCLPATCEDNGLVQLSRAYDAGDFNGDGVPDVIGSILLFTGTGWLNGYAGRAAVFSGVDSSILRIISGQNGDDVNHICPTFGDWNGDGLNDVIVGTHEYFGGYVHITTGHETQSPDIDADGVVSGLDLGVLLLEWGSGKSAADLNSDGAVDACDLSGLLANWSQ